MTTNTLRPYGPGKFDTMLDAYVHGLTLDGCDDETGDVQTSCWYGRLNGFGADDDRTLEANGYTEDERAFLARMIGAIVSEDSQGFVSVTYYTDPAELEADWQVAVEETTEDVEAE